MTLAEAYRNTKAKLCGDYLNNVETEEGIGVAGEDLVKMVNKIYKNLLGIRQAIKIYGKDFVIPADSEEIPEEHKELFVGCYKIVIRMENKG